MKLLRRASEMEVIAEFLKNEFYHPEFHRDRVQFEPLVMHADTSDEGQNALRRALLFRRRGSMWRELPPDTQWWEVEMEPRDLDHIFVFPRAHWRKIAGGDFRLTVIVERLRARRGAVPGARGLPGYGRASRGLQEFVSKIESLSNRIRSLPDNSAVLLISTAAGQPMLIFEGNHRLSAALLASAEVAQTRFRVFLGCSPNMARCCWYRASFANLLRYAKNRVLHLGYDREADVERVRKELEAHRLPEFAKTVPGKVVPESKSAPTNLS
jgi:hypothetical protein